MRSEARWIRGGGGWNVFPMVLVKKSVLRPVGI